MRAIFYDLETSDKHRIGQILNYCFVAVNAKLEVVEELSGEIRISRLQLPTAGAILTNRINVLNHQATAVDTEFAAMEKIHQFVNEHFRQSKATPVLIGFNSERFDLPFLRTSMIRNGINPYFYGKPQYKDLLCAARKLAVSRPDFPRYPKGESPDQESSGRLSLTLENLSKRLKILVGEQTHHSRDDVYLSIELARVFRDSYDLDVLKYQQYELNKVVPAGAICYQLEPNYDLNSDQPVLKRVMACLQENYRYALWIDLDRYASGQGRDSISWIKKNGGLFIFGGWIVDSSEYEELAKNALLEFRDINLDNFFTQSTCDIEQDIYRLDINMIDSLGAAIRNSDRSFVLSRDGSNRDAMILFIRHQLSSYEWSAGTLSSSEEQGLTDSDLKVRDQLRQYAIHRYNGGLQVDRYIPEEEPEEDKEKLHFVHQTYKEILSELQSKLADPNSREEDLALLNSLYKFYLDSDILRVAGDDLL